MYYKKVNLSSNKECFEFLTSHFTYDTMNSWNRLKSIANNVKIYNLPVDYDDAMKVLEESEYMPINNYIEGWEEEHPGYTVGFNGRSGGYLVLRSKLNNGHVFDSDPCSPCQYNDYEDWKKDVQDYWGSLKAYHPELVSQVKLVQDFDRLCDDLLEVLRDMIKQMHIRNSHTFGWEALKRHEHYVYDTLEDMKYHKEYMLQQGYGIFDYSEDDLYAEYEMNESVSGEVVIEYDDSESNE